MMTGGARALAASPLAVAQALAEHEPMVEFYRQFAEAQAATDHADAQAAAAADDDWRVPAAVDAECERLGEVAVDLQFAVEEAEPVTLLGVAMLARIMAFKEIIGLEADGNLALRVARL
jgi:hypothetical protein